MKHHDRRVSGENFTGELKGVGHSGALKRQRGLRGTKLGPANEGRSVSDDERKSIEDDLRSKGLIR